MSPERGSERLPRSSRIRSSRDFRRIGREGRRFASQHFVLLVGEPARRPSSDRGGSRLGLTASRRVGNAVARNRIKRQVREWFRKSKISAGREWVVIARRGAATLGSREVWRQLDDLWGRATRGVSSESATITS